MRTLRLQQGALYRTFALPLVLRPDQEIEQL